MLVTMPARVPGVEAADSTLVEVGSLVGGRYRVEALLGRGAMGAVYRVTDERKKKPLALKRILAGDPGERSLSLSLLEHEFHMLSELEHPCIVSVYDYGVDEDGAFYTMELLDGGDLSGQKKLPWLEVAMILRDVASALAILHSRRLLHGDLSTRNVRSTADGRAKLIDFGTMTPMGLPKRVVGTPPFMAPELLERQSLDARADLFSLGAIAYSTLTGRHAYPSRSLKELPDAWNRPLPSPAEREPSVPEALSELVMELLRRDRMARPSSAAAVIERLCALASLPRDERKDVSRAYLAMPALVGRQAAIADVRSKLAGQSARRAATANETGSRRGVTLVVEGESGTGRSRFLDACVIEAKLCGATVLRTSASDGGPGDYAVARTLASQLIEELPEVSEKVVRPVRRVLAHVIGELETAPNGNGAHATASPERRHVQAALRDWVLGVARQRRLVLAVDDFDRVDEPSAAWLAALSHHGARRNLSVFVTTEPRPTAAAVRLVQSTGQRILLAPLTGEELETLMRSVFGAADNVVVVARHIFELCRGYPRPAMDLAQHLVDQGLARYEAGSWVLPRRLDPGDLPRAVPIARLSLLSEAARDLAQLLALTDESSLALSDYPDLMGGDAARAYRGLSDLIAADILVPAGVGYRFVHRGISDVIASEMAPDRRIFLHGRLARIKEQQNDPFNLAHHLLEAGERERGVEVVRATRKKRALGLRPGVAGLLERAVFASEALGLPNSERVPFTAALVGVCALLGDQERFSRHAPALLAQLKRDSGLDDWHALEREGVPESERLFKAFERARERYESTAESERGLPGQEAFAQLARVSSSFSSMASISMDAQHVLSLPSFRPFNALSPAIEVLDQSLGAVREFMTCRGKRARANALAVVERVRQPDRAGLEDSVARSLKFGMLYMLGAMDAFDGLPNATEHVAEFENTPGYRGNAWRVRRVAHLLQGNFDAASECHRRAELFELLDGAQQAFPGTVIRIEAMAHWMVGDLAGLKEAIERIAELSEVFPAWRNTLDVARSHYRRLQGDAEGALEEILPALQRSAPSLDADWPWVVAAHVSALTAVGRHNEAAELGLAYYQKAQELELSPPVRSLVKPLCAALVKAGRVSRALELSESALHEITAEGVSGVWLGSFYEARAHIAIAMGDRSGFEFHAARCAEEYRRGRNSSLVANYERLMREAERQAVCVSNELVHAAEFTERAGMFSESSRTARSVLSRLAECSGPQERVEYALRMLMERTEANGGILYALRSGGLARIAAIPSVEAPPGLEAALETFAREQLEVEPATVSIAALPSADAVTNVNTVAEIRLDDKAGVIHPVALFTQREGELAIAGVVALRHAERVVVPDLDLVSALADSLMMLGDTDPVTCLA